MTRQSVYVSCGAHELHVSTWGNPDRPAVILWHGLARTGRDFDELALALADNYFVLAPDTLGRGLSSWAQDEAVDYSYAAYGTHAAAILDHFGIDKLRWLGTSMGGLIGVTLAAGPLRDRITHLVVNDIGPFVPEAATSRIADYVGNPPMFDHVAELELWLRRNYAPFGQNTDAFWRRLADSSTRRADDGRVTVHYDPRIVNQFTLHKADLDRWPHWDAITAKLMLVRGAASDVLPSDVAAEMQRRQPGARFHEFPDCGHAPTLADPIGQSLVREFLAQP